MNKILSTINGMFFPKQVMMIFNRSIGISISLKSRILSYYFQIQNFILKTLPDVNMKNPRTVLSISTLIHAPPIFPTYFHIILI